MNHAEEAADHSRRLMEDPKVQEILTLIPGLVRLESEIARTTSRRPIGVVLPARLNPGRYDGPGATDAPSQVMGYPITWGEDEHVGLIISL